MIVLVRVILSCLLFSAVSRQYVIFFVGLDKQDLLTDKLNGETT